MKNDRIWELLARKMSGELSAGEMDEMEQILRVHPHLYFSVQAFSELWRQSSSPVIDREAIDAYARHLQKLKQQGIQVGQQENSKDHATVLLEGTRKSSFRLYTYIAAAAVVIVLAALWYTKSDTPATEPVIASTSQQTNSEVSVKYGSKTRIQLPDGSQVWLNAGSKLNYKNDFGKEIREVELIGEGFFDVVKNAKKPFVIHTSSIDIKVLGTQFNVKSYPGDRTSETSLVRGRVEVVVRRRPDEKYILKPNEKIVVLNEDTTDNRLKATFVKTKIEREPIIAIKKLTYKEGDSISVEAAWAYNKLSFEDESFAEVAKKMERWYDVRFEFRNKGLEDIRLKGTFINESLSQAMEALKYTNRFKYEITGKTVEIY